MINAMSPGSRAIAEFQAANARVAKEPARQPAPTGGERGRPDEPELGPPRSGPHGQDR
ncbi:MAG: hypothetical protein ACYC9Q_09410 [Bacillota bacterium]